MLLGFFIEFLIVGSPKPKRVSLNILTDNFWYWVNSCFPLVLPRTQRNEKEIGKETERKKSKRLYLQ